MAKNAFLFRRKKGDILQPGRFTPAVVRGLKAKPREWAGQYQQEPAPSTGLIFNPSWWQFYRSRDPLPDFDIVAISVDCAFKSKAENDFVSIHKWGAVGARCYLLQKETRHLGYAATKAMIRAVQNEGLRASVVLIEDKANGSAVVEELRADDFGADVIAVEPSGGKEARAHAASATVEAKNVFLPEDAPWLAEFLRVTAAFPVVRHDDDVDAMTQFLNWRRGRNQGELGVLELLKRRAKEIAEGIRDAFGDLIHKPEPEPAVIQNKMATIAISKPNVFEQKIPPCPSCGNFSTRVIPGGRVGYPLAAMCDQCECEFDSISKTIVKEPVSDKPGHVHRWRDIPGGYQRCDDCEQQRRKPGEPEIVTCGVKRSDYMRGVGRRRLF